MKMRTRLIKLLAGLWASTSALIAIILIVSALVFGFWYGARTERETHGPAQASSQMEGVEPQKEQLYTCSMHPQIRLKDKSAKCPICFMDLIPVAAGAITDPHILGMSPEAAALASVATTRVIEDFPLVRVDLVGQVHEDETRSRSVTAWIDGRIEHLLADYTGLRVESGAVIAELYSPQIATAIAELRQALRNAPSGSGPTSGLAAAARDRVRLLGLDDTTIESLLVSSDPEVAIPIRAPFGGVIMHRAVNEGDYVTTGQTIVHVADLSSVWVDFEAYESQMPLVRLNQQVRFSAEAIPGKTFDGAIIYIDPVLDSRTRTVTVRIAAPNADGSLRPGMLVRGALRVHLDATGSPVTQLDMESADSKPALLIPHTAVLFTGRRSVVYLATGDEIKPQFTIRMVTLGPRTETEYVVLEGLERSDHVVSKGAFMIDSEMQIAGKFSMMHPEDDEELDIGKPLKASPAMLNSLKPLYFAYLRSAEALAADDLDGFRFAAADLADALAIVDESTLAGARLGQWRRIRAAIDAHTSHAGMVDIGGARTILHSWSKAMIDLVEQFGSAGSTVLHRSYCPMAFDDTGAEWLARSEEISNPYFGSMMLRCGEVRESYRPVDTADQSGARP